MTNVFISVEEDGYSMLGNNELPADHECVRNNGRLSFHTQNKAKLAHV